MIAPRLFEISGDCLVTGATGLVGNNVVRQLLAKDVGVRALVRQTSPVGDTALAGLPVERVARGARGQGAGPQPGAGLCRNGSGLCGGVDAF